MEHMNVRRHSENLTSASFYYIKIRELGKWNKGFKINSATNVCINHCYKAIPICCHSYHGESPFVLIKLLFLCHNVLFSKIYLCSSICMTRQKIEKTNKKPFDLRIESTGWLVSTGLMCRLTIYVSIMKIPV